MRCIKVIKPLRFWLVLAAYLALKADGGQAGHETRASKERASAALRSYLAEVYALETALAPTAAAAPVPSVPPAAPPSTKVPAAQVSAAPSQQGVASVSSAWQLAVKDHVKAGAEALQRIAPSLPPDTRSLLEAAWQELASEIARAQAGGAPALYEKAQRLRHRSWELLQVDAVPAHTPDWQLAEATFSQHCASCHGVDGRGGGVLAARLPVQPQPLGDAAFAAQQAPLMVYNTLLDGVRASPMPGFKGQLSSRELWSLSYFLVGRAHPIPQTPLTADERQWLLSSAPSLRFLAQVQDAELLQWLLEQKTQTGKALCQGSRCQELRAYLRRQFAFEGGVRR